MNYYYTAQGTIEQFVQPYTSTNTNGDMFLIDIVKVYNELQNINIPYKWEEHIENIKDYKFKYPNKEVNFHMQELIRKHKHHFENKGSFLDDLMKIIKEREKKNQEVNRMNVMKENTNNKLLVDNRQKKQELHDIILKLKNEQNSLDIKINEHIRELSKL
jgi:hypothetical protein